MTDYTELIHALRYCADRNMPDCSVCEYEAYDDCDDKLKRDAAAAIEALQAEVDEQKQITAHYEQTAKDYWKEACEYHAIVSAKDITAKESEELIRKFKKLPCGPIEPNEPKRGEWEREMDVNDEPFYQCSVCGECFDFNSDSTHEVFNYCPNCGADMRKMEVQDGQ